MTTERENTERMTDLSGGRRKFVRITPGKISGTIEGIARAMNFDPFLMRVLWLVSVPLSGGASIVLYLMFWLSLPKSGENLQSPNDARPHRVLGVCEALSLKYNWDVGLVRFVALASLLASAGLALLMYVALFLLLPYESRKA